MSQIPAVRETAALSIDPSRTFQTDVATATEPPPPERDPHHERKSADDNPYTGVKVLTDLALGGTGYWVGGLIASTACGPAAPVCAAGFALGGLGVGLLASNKMVTGEFRPLDAALGVGLAGLTMGASRFLPPIPTKPLFQLWLADAPLIRTMAFVEPLMLENTVAESSLLVTKTQLPGLVITKMREQMIAVTNEAVTGSIKSTQFFELFVTPGQANTAAGVIGNIGSSFRATPVASAQTPPEPMPK